MSKPGALTATDWQDRLYAALRLLESRAAPATAAAGGPIDVALGFTNSIDRIVELDGTSLASLAATSGITSWTPDSPVESRAEFLAALLHHVRTGQGGEVWLGNDSLGDWIAATFHGRPQAGGTGVRAANTVARLDRNALLHVTSLPPEQAGLIDNSGRIVLATANGPRRPNDCARPNDPRREHIIFEFQAGLTVPLATGAVVAPHANRVIVSRDPANLCHPLDDRFVSAVADADAIRWVLVSGYSQVTDAAMAADRIAETRAAISRWRQAATPPRIHLELEAMPSAEVLALVLDRLAPAVESLGCNEDELAAIAHLRHFPHPIDAVGLVSCLRHLQRDLKLPRVSLHTRHFCLTVTRDDPAAEQAALLAASLVAGAFARRADYCSLTELRQMLTASAPSADGVAIGHELALAGSWRDGVRRDGAFWLVYAPTISIPRPATTIGLGDSFTGGILAML